MIGIDWGTSNFRAFRFDDAGEVIERRSSDQGILRVRNGGFEDVLREQVGDWLNAGETRILLCGMVGSRQGWAETEYLSCPVGIADLASSVIALPFSGAEVLLIPGVLGADSCGIPEVMRGEETQLVGMLQTWRRDGLVCLPGTHSKWIQFTGGTIVGFTTSMTGDVYAALLQSTILSRMSFPDAAGNNDAFLRGVTRSMDPGGLLHHLFSVRTLTLMDRLQQHESASYLSGLLIGHEVGASMPAGAHLHLAGDSQLCSLYAQAIETCGGSFTLEQGNAAAMGLAAIGRRLSWI